VKDEKHNKMLKRLEDLKDTDACPHGDINNLITWNECTLCGKQFNPKEHHGNASVDGFLCDNCYCKSKEMNEK
jgi:hypothetical protein